MGKQKANNLIIKLILLILLIVGFFYRIYGLSANYSFWVDEFSTGQFATAIVKTGTPQTVTGFVETRNLLHHYITAASMKIFGVNEFAARFPSVIFGTAMILVVFLVFRRIFNEKVGLAMAALTTFSVIEITWSRQARSYALFQLVYFLTVYFFWQLFRKIEKKKLSFRDLIIPAILLIFSFLSHFLTVTVILTVITYAIFFARKDILRFFKNLSMGQKIIIGVFFTILFLLLWQLGLNGEFRKFFVSREIPLKIYNNFWYYHSFLWRQYSLVFFLGFLGILFAFFNRERKYFFLINILIIHSIVVIFFLRWLNVRYLYPIFPIFFFVFLVYFLDNLTLWWLRKSPRFQVYLLFFFVFFLILNGHKFTFKPRLFYSPNADMREIPLVDYNVAYATIKKEIQGEGQSIAVVDTWGDRIAWYLGRDYPSAYWIYSPEKVKYETENNQKFDTIFHFGFIANKEDLIKVMEKNKKGFVFIDGHEVSFLPKDALWYIENNLKLEVKFDRFSLDPDPYDTWPAWLYSWGMERN